MKNNISKKYIGIFLVVLLTGVLLVSNIIAKWSITFFRDPLLLSMLLYPLGFAIMTLIVKEYNKNKAFWIIILISIIQIIIFYITKLCGCQVFIGETEMYFSVIGFIVGQIINIILINNTSNVLRYIIISVIDNVIFLMIYSMWIGNYNLVFSTTLIATVTKIICGLIYEYIFVKLLSSDNNKKESY